MLPFPLRLNPCFIQWSFSSPLVIPRCFLHDLCPSQHTNFIPLSFPLCFSLPPPFFPAFLYVLRSSSFTLFFPSPLLLLYNFYASLSHTFPLYFASIPPASPPNLIQALPHCLPAPRHGNYPLITFAVSLSASSRQGCSFVRQTGWQENRQANR